MEWYGSPLTLLPPLVTIGLAIVTQRVRLSLSIGLGCGALLATQLDPLAAAARTAGFLFHVALDADNILITTFSLLVAGMVAVIERNGGTIALVRKAERIVRGPRSAMAASWLAGLFVFFDDYANCLMVGTTFRPLYDRHKLSHAKLAYIVDSTAAPVASFAVISTWIGYELGLLADALDGVPLAGGLLVFFVSTLPFRFYSIYSLAFVGAVALSGRDFGPMACLEHKTRVATLTVEQNNTPEPAQSAWLAAGPILSLLLATLVCLYWDGRASAGASGPAGPTLLSIMGAADPYRSMAWGAGVAFVVSVVLSLSGHALTLPGVLQASWHGMRRILGALVILYLAWGLGTALETIGTAHALTDLLTDSVTTWSLPALTFLVAAAVSFATGSSFSTMAILIPLVVPLAVSLAGGTAGPPVPATVGAVLAGACFGDHISPISDTTILSATASGVEVMTHVRTQLPYALTVGAVSLCLGYLPAGFGISPFILLPLGVGLGAALVWGLGRRGEAGDS